jgi:hypothetical protein
LGNRLIAELFQRRLFFVGLQPETSTAAQLAALPSLPPAAILALGSKPFYHPATRMGMARIAALPVPPAGSGRPAGGQK